MQVRDSIRWLAAASLAVACHPRNVQDVAQRRGDDETDVDSPEAERTSDASGARNLDASISPSVDAAPSDSRDAGQSTTAPNAVLAATTEPVGSSSNSTPSPYIPTGPDVPVGGDGRLAEGGSFETSQGFGWDTCPGAAANGIGLFIQNPNYAPDATLDEAADGDRYVHLLPPLPAGAPERPEGVNAPFAFYFDPGSEIEPGVPHYLYFEIKNQVSTAPDGALTFAGLEITCETKEQWLTVSLTDLELTTNWETRCVELQATQTFQAFGLWASGPDFSIGVDVFRFGPPCH